MREHDLTVGPFPIDRSASVERKLTGRWKQELGAEVGAFVALARDGVTGGMAGWCTSSSALLDSPEVEVISGGYNSKGPDYGAIWRQGHLLHFGFQEDPSELNETGRHLLLNAIAYIARFTEDRPIPIDTRGGTWLRTRETMDYMMTLKYRKDVQPYVTAELWQSLSETDRADFAAYWREHRGYLRPDANNRFAYDADARTLGVPYDDPAIFTAALAAKPPRLAYLAQLAPEGPGADASLEAWRAWSAQHRDYVFFSDSGGYRWYVDPLAKKRGIASANLRGAARATLPKVELARK